MIASTIRHVPELGENCWRLLCWPPEKDLIKKLGQIFLPQSRGIIHRIFLQLPKQFGTFCCQFSWHCKLLHPNIG